jgi:hypothetical protein
MMRRSITIHLSLLLVGLAFFALSASRASAQDSNEELNSGARKFDEFGAIGGCDLGARLDNLAIQLQNEPTATGYIICYGPEGEGYGTGRSGLSIMMDYLVNTRGMDAERIKTIYGGHYKEWQEVSTELWIAPHDAAAPEPLRYNPKVEPFTGMFEEFEAWDNRFYEDAGTGPSFSSSKRASFATLLRQQTEARAYIVAYNRKEAVPGAWRRAAKEVADGLRNEYKVEAERIEIIYGGYRQRAEKKEGEEEEQEGAALVQLWILPKDAPPPVAAVKEAEERPLEAALLGYFSDYTLINEREARRAFEGFADVLRSDERLNACLIIRVEKQLKETVEPEETPAAVDVPAETSHTTESPKADIVALVEKWRADLVKEYGISEHRLVVTTAEKDENTYYELEMWIVPHGAALPDPNAKDEETEQAEAITTDEVTQDEGTQKEF